MASWSARGANYVAGKFGNGIQFPANSSATYVQVPYTTAFAATNYTFSTWINVPYAGGGGIAQRPPLQRPAGAGHVLLGQRHPGLRQ